MALEANGWEGFSGGIGEQSIFLYIAGQCSSRHSGHLSSRLWTLPLLCSWIPSFSFGPAINLDPSPVTAIPSFLLVFLMGKCLSTHYRSKYRLKCLSWLLCPAKQMCPSWVFIWLFDLLYVSVPFPSWVTRPGLVTQMCHVTLSQPLLALLMKVHSAL